MRFACVYIFLLQNFPLYFYSLFHAHWVLSPSRKIEYFCRKFSRWETYYCQVWYRKQKTWNLGCVFLVLVFYRMPLLLRDFCVYMVRWAVYMGSKSRRKSTTSKKCKSNFPVGELSKQRATLRAEYLSKSKEICTLKKRLQRLKNKVSLAWKRFFLVKGEDYRVARKFCGFLFLRFFHRSAKIYSRVNVL